jgi:hypothetical protein
MPSEVLPDGSGTDTQPSENDDTLPNEAISLRAVRIESDVAVVRWPSQQRELEDLALRGVPRLLLVAPGSAAPNCTSCLEDWVRLPADEADLRARLLSLAEHGRGHTRPTIDEYGILRRDGALAMLSPSEQALAGLLIADFGSVVRDEILEQHVLGASDARRSMLRTHTSRLRKRVAPLGLTVSCIRNVGYMMHDDSGSDVTFPS